MSPPLHLLDDPDNPTVFDTFAALSLGTLYGIAAVLFGWMYQVLDLGLFLGLWYGVMTLVHFFWFLICPSPPGEERAGLLDALTSTGAHLLLLVIAGFAYIAIEDEFMSEFFRFADMLWVGLMVVWGVRMGRGRMLEAERGRRFAGAIGAASLLLTYLVTLTPLMGFHPTMAPMALPLALLHALRSLVGVTFPIQLAGVVYFSAQAPSAEDEGDDW